VTAGRRSRPFGAGPLSGALSLLLPAILLVILLVPALLLLPALLRGAGLPGRAATLLRPSQGRPVLPTPTVLPDWARNAARVTSGPISATVTADGTLTSALQARVAFRSGGRLKELLVAPGESVAAGQKLATIDPTELEQAVAQAQANLGLSQARLEAAQAAARAEDVGAARATLEAVQAQIRQSQGVSEQLDALLTVADATVEGVRAGLTPPGRLVRAEDEAAAEGAVRAARARVAAMLAGAARVPDAPALLTQLQARLGQAQAALGPEPAGPSASEVPVAQAQVDVAQAQLEQARLNLDTGTLLAPFAATVGAVHAAPGEPVSAGAPVVTVVDRRRLRAEVLLDEVDVTRVRPGQSATVSFESAPGRTARGNVGAVLPVPIQQGGQARFPVHITIEETPESELLPGMTVRAQIVTAARERTLLIPTRALHLPAQPTPGATPGAAPGSAPGTAGGEGPAVYVVSSDGRRATRRAITTGISTSHVTEVIEGLAEGERVVMPPPVGAPVGG
jgi:multidrug efflux pump subunit AcrA (membrane-fusion protein)